MLAFKYPTDPPSFDEKLQGRTRGDGGDGIRIITRIIDDIDNLEKNSRGNLRSSLGFRTLSYNNNKPRRSGVFIVK
jgi:hypothetical protein